MVPAEGGAHGFIADEEMEDEVEDEGEDEVEEEASN